MTHHTDAERQAFEAVASDNGKWPQAIERDAKGNYLLLTTANGWMWWQAARRAPEPVPQWGKAGTCEWYDGYADHSDGGGPYKERVLYTAPTPAEAAPVKFPEPVAWRDPKNFLPSQGCTYEKSTAKKWAHIYTEALYTEQQVRELMAANGIKVNQ